MFKKIIKLIIFSSSFLLFIPITKDIKLNAKVDNIINNKKNNSSYEGYIYIPKFNYRNVIKRDEEALDNNLVFMPKYSDSIGESNIILAGHNNKYVFSKIYNLNINDEIIISDFKVDYKYIVNDKKIINVKEYEELYNKDSLTLITCTGNNQYRYIVIAKRE